MRGAIAAGAVIAVGIAAAVCYIKKLKGIAEKALAKRREKRAHAIASVASMGSVASMESVASMASMASITSNRSNRSNRSNASYGNQAPMYNQGAPQYYY